MGVHEFPILNPPPTFHPISSGSSPCTSPKHPVSCIEPRLAIHFLHDSIHVSMSLSQILPPSPSPSESKSPLYTSVSLLLSHIQGHHYHLSKFQAAVTGALKCSQEELPHIRGQGQRPRVPDCDGAGTVKRSYPTSEVGGRPGGDTPRP